MCGSLIEILHYFFYNIKCVGPSPSISYPYTIKITSDIFQLDNKKIMPKGVGSLVSFLLTFITI